jgi:hypothetical protein
VQSGFALFIEHLKKSTNFSRTLNAKFVARFGSVSM